MQRAMDNPERLQRDLLFGISQTAREGIDRMTSAARLEESRAITELMQQLTEIGLGVPSVTMQVLQKLTEIGSGLPSATIQEIQDEMRDLPSEVVPVDHSLAEIGRTAEIGMQKLTMTRQFRALANLLKIHAREIPVKHQQVDPDIFSNGSGSDSRVSRPTDEGITFLDSERSVLPSTDWLDPNRYLVIWAEQDMCFRPQRVDWFEADVESILCHFVIGWGGIPTMRSVDFHRHQPGTPRMMLPDRSELTDGLIIGLEWPYSFRIFLLFYLNESAVCLDFPPGLANAIQMIQLNRLLRPAESLYS